MVVLYGDDLQEATLISNDLQHYDTVLRRLRYPQRLKVMRLLEMGCVERKGEQLYIVHPVPGYNVTTYTVLHVDRAWVCDCQGFMTKLKRGTPEPSCSHIMACRLCHNRYHTHQQYSLSFA